MECKLFLVINKHGIYIDEITQLSDTLSQSPTPSAPSSSINKSDWFHLLQHASHLKSDQFDEIAAFITHVEQHKQELFPK